MKSILLLVHEDEGQEARLNVAIDIARATDGHIICLDLVALPQVYLDPYQSFASEALLPRERERDASNAAMIKARLAQCCISWEWLDVAGYTVDDVRHAAKFCDVIVLNSLFETAYGPDLRRLIEDVLVAAQRPVLAVPENDRGVRLNGRAMIAWDGSDEAVASLKAAVPLLRLACEVILLKVGDTCEEYGVKQAVAYLGRQDIASQVVEKRGHGPVADLILHTARSFDVGYIVMGAFGHSRTIEAVFGGVTRTMLRTSDRPLFLLHC